MGLVEKAQLLRQFGQLGTIRLRQMPDGFLQAVALDHPFRRHAHSTIQS